MQLHTNTYNCIPGGGNFVVINKSSRLIFDESNHFLSTRPIAFSFIYAGAASMCRYPAFKASSSAASIS